MEDQTVCCMCGDVGFSSQLLRCTSCCNRYQHSYCSSFYDGSAGVCDWCRSKERSDANHGVRSRKLAAIYDRSEYSGGKIKQEDGEESCERGKSRVSSGRHTSRRYKLLKDVLCSTE